MDPTTYAGWFEAFIKNASATALVCSIVFGWGFTMLVRFPLHQLIENDAWATWWTRFLCVVSSIFMALIFWPVAPLKIRIGWALTIGVISPLIWWLLLRGIAVWRPTLAEGLQLKRISLDTDDTESGAKPQEPKG